jgi:hypothetical protein
MAIAWECFLLFALVQHVVPLLSLQWPLVKQFPVAWADGVQTSAQLIFFMFMISFLNFQQSCCSPSSSCAAPELRAPSVKSSNLRLKLLDKYNLWPVYDHNL